MNVSTPMPKYKCHKEVWALKIKKLEGTGTQEQESDGSLLMTPEEDRFSAIVLPSSYVQKHRPHVGGYYVVYEDGYKSFSPAKAFESGYTAIERN